MEKLKRVVVKEELVSITGNFVLAIVLGQFLYWSDRVRDFDKLLLEEKSRAEKDGNPINNIEPANGWIYKKSEELVDETMLGISRQCMRNNISKLVEQGYLFERNNPKYKWDKTKQYRVNFKKINHDLNEKGYSLDGYKITDGLDDKMPTKPVVTESKNFTFECQDEIHSKVKNLRSSETSWRAIPEITTENTNNDTTLYSATSGAQNDTNNKREQIRAAIDYVINHVQDKTIAEKIFAIFEIRDKKHKDVTVAFAKIILKNLEDWSDGDYQEKIDILDKSIEYDAITIFKPDNKHYKNNKSAEPKSDKSDVCSDSYPASYKKILDEDSYDIEKELAWAYSSMVNQRKQIGKVI